MEYGAKLTMIKIIHTLIWLFFSSIIFYMLYATIVNKLDKWLWIDYGFIMAEVVTLLIFKGRCPLTLIASKYSNSRKDNFDIYLPTFIAKYNKLIYSAIMIIIFILTIYQLLN
ncbi:hypothetical protein AHMF7605_27720 [Adhaeribacter arboris]|uniref:DUF2784 domain-containing protein n=1 Tax=Adhaeribacter arboris TaxID=2072846 RepID=A0A2T2YPP1_9BACT|nr:hypothetical protein AHMF7605_27720 [Adhaeribacter arboris]